jgi:hypothetical protein
MVLGLQVVDCTKRSVISFVLIGACFHTIFITSNSASEILGKDFIINMCGLDMAWDAMHHADDKFMVLKTPGQVAEIARALPERAKEGENRKA